MINLNDYLSCGQNAIVQNTVKDTDASSKYITPFRELLASPKLLHWAIDASVDAIDPYLPEDYASIGTSINFTHTAPTSVGMTVTVHVVITEIKFHFNEVSYFFFIVEPFNCKNFPFKLGKSVIDNVKYRLVQFFLIPEVLVYQCLIYTGLFGNIIHPCAVIAEF